MVPLHGLTKQALGCRDIGTLTGNDHIFRQLFEPVSCTYTYLLADKITREAVIIDPVLEKVERDLKQVQQLDLNLKYAINTHVHADHVTGTGKLKQHFKGCCSVLSGESGGAADIHLQHADILQFGKFSLEFRSTPGHTDGCMSILWKEAGAIFTGDAVLIRKCGRTDFQQGDAGKLYDVVHEHIFSLPPDTLIYPGHDYDGLTVSTVGEEIQFNTRLNKSRGEFVETMNNLNLPLPKQIDRSLPANLNCGL